MALYPGAVLRLIKPGPNDPAIKPRVAILHVDGANGSGEALYGYFRDRSGGVESHFHIELDGTVFQFRDTAFQADANSDANDFAISIETQGRASGLWTPEQLASIKALLSWLNQVHDIPLVKCSAWNGSGIGYHILFMERWAGGPRACPGPDRIKQFHSILVPWMANPQEDNMTPAQEAKLDYVQEQNKANAEDILYCQSQNKINGKEIAAARADIAALKKALDDFAAGLPATVRAGVAAALSDSAEYEARVELTPKDSP